MSPPPSPAERAADGSAVTGSQRWVVAALILLSILLSATIVHIASLLVLPHVAPNDAFARVVAVAREGVVTSLPRGEAVGATLEARDPALDSAVCRYDLARGPFRISAALDDEVFMALTLHSRSGVSFYGLNDRAGNGGRLEVVVMTAAQLGQAQARDTPDAPVRDVRVVAPESEGFVLVDALPRLGGARPARGVAESMSCRVEPPS